MLDSLFSKISGLQISTLLKKTLLYSGKKDTYMFLSEYSGEGFEKNFLAEHFLVTFFVFKASNFDIY